jgi:hypothetical protein
MKFDHGQGGTDTLLWTCQARGVPRKLRIDNLVAAVVLIDKGGKRKYTEAYYVMYR